MPDKPIASIAVHFSDLTNPRRDKSRIRHKLLDMVVIAICALLCGADSSVAVESFGHAKMNWLSKLLKLPNGIPSHDTFSSVFGLVDSIQFEHCFINWLPLMANPCVGLMILRPTKERFDSSVRGHHHNR